MAARPMKLGLNIVANGAHAAGWRLPEAKADAALDFELWTMLATRAETACLHFMFWADGAAIRHNAPSQEALAYLARIDVWEPLTVIGALAALTKRLGFIASVSTTFNEPYHVARKLASLDHISKGRVGWNVVTSWSEQEARNFGRAALMPHAQRYARAEEFVDVVTALWDSFEDDAFIRDKASGRYFDADKLHPPGHAGRHFAVEGPLNIARPVQGYPIIAQAGSSGPGQALGTRIADIIYTAQKDKAAAAAFYRAIKAQAASIGRDPARVLVMPGILPIIGATRRQAADRFEALQELVPPALGLPLLKASFGDLAGLDLDGPLPPPLPESNALKSEHAALVRLAAAEGMTIRKLYQILAGASGHYIVHGTASDVADRMQDWFEGEACDGFNLMPAWLPGAAFDLFDQLVPELQRRGLAQTAYAGDGTLRGSLGLPRPPHRRHRSSAPGEDRNA
ncbi:alkanesulfonate monooxygenase [Arboricoccus pini]|uniref:Alkanesulfonate monooxygenase n=1 Tax=Arboricoccus pini TaxID=1963835 RepID=A0A212RQJ7_9PROT|nr:LLM class flavin-dependent oxidoreductase [Arboricoccus pini]SNB74801.1 alkanesulfonate monooxygenase [Arboricoccus pini]